MPESDRDILIEVRTDVKALVRDMTEPGGRVPTLQADVKIQGDQIAFWRGAIWIIGGLLLLFGGVLAAHIHVH